MAPPIMPVDGKLPCGRCKRWLPVGSFNINRRRPCGRRSYCRECQKAHVYEWRAEKPEGWYGDYQAEWRKRNQDHVTAYHRSRDLMRKYGLTVAEYDEMLAKQDGRCAVCRSADPGNGRYRRFLVDHDHATGAVRALLCHPCNVALGQVEDSPERLMALARYLLSFQDVLGAEHTA